MQNENCNTELLTRYLSRKGNSAEDETLERHLDHWQVCRVRIEREAADEPFWRAVQSHLDTFRDTYHDASATKRLEAKVEPTPKTEAGYRRFLAEWLDADEAGCLGRLHEYRILEIIGSGGMGLVLKAKDSRLDRLVAIKTLRSLAVQTDETAKERFFREATLAASLQSPHVISIFHIDTWRDIPYLVMPYIEGGSLAEFAQKRRLEFREVLDIGQQIAAGLAAAHEAGMIHRDVKPSNVLLSHGLDQVLIADFGLARRQEQENLTVSGLIVGTPQFMSPEQAQGRPIDTRSDLFSLGSLLYWMTTGSYPFDTDHSLATLARVVGDEPVPLEKIADVPGWFGRLVRLLHSKSPDARIISAKQIAEVFQRASESWDDRAMAEHLPPVLRPPFHGFKILIAATVLAGCMTASWYFARPSSVSHPLPSQTDSLKTFPDKELEPDNGLTQTERTQTEFYLAEQLVPNREGSLDALDRLNLVEDLTAKRHVHYWLRRLERLSTEEVPLESLPLIEKLQEDQNAEIRELAKRIVLRNPFVFIEPITSEK